MGIKLLIILFSIQSQATTLNKYEFKEFTEVIQVPEFYSEHSFSTKERCQIAKWVHENNSLLVYQMYSKGYKVHPERLQRTSDDIHFNCQYKDSVKRSSPRCDHYEDCLHEAEIYRIILDN